jgi:hypothetical protein
MRNSNVEANLDDGALDQDAFVQVNPRDRNPAADIRC